jgi:hypothetical protein
MSPWEIHISSGRKAGLRRNRMFRPPRKPSFHRARSNIPRERFRMDRGKFPTGNLNRADSSTGDLASRRTGRRRGLASTSPLSIDGNSLPGWSLRAVSSC